MSKKFIINDDDGKQFEVTEETVDEEPEVDTEVHDEELTADEIASLKELAKHSVDLINLLNVEKNEHEAISEDSDEGVDEDVDTQDEDVCPNCGKPKDECTCDEDETVIETKTGDSKKSVGSIAKKVNKVSDSADNREIAIANAWANRYKKSYKKGE